MFSFDACNQYFQDLTDHFSSNAEMTTVLNPFVLITLVLVCMALPRKYQVGFFCIVAGVLSSSLSSSADSMMTLQPVRADALQHSVGVQTVSATITQLLDDGIKDYADFPAYDRLEGYRRRCENKYQGGAATLQLGEDVNNPDAPAEFTFPSTVFFNGEQRPAWAPVIFEFKCMRYSPLQSQMHPAALAASWEKIPVVTRVRGLVLPVHTGGRNRAPAVYGLEISGDLDQADRGHLFALELGGPDIAANIVPQPSIPNRYGDWRDYEVRLVNHAVAGTNALQKLKTIDVDETTGNEKLLMQNDFQYLVYYEAEAKHDKKNIVTEVSVRVCQFDPKQNGASGAIPFYDYNNALLKDWAKCQDRNTHTFNFNTAQKLDERGRPGNAYDIGHPSRAGAMAAGVTGL